MKHRQKAFFPGLPLLLCLGVLFSGCSWLQGELVLPVKLPDLPREWLSYQGTILFQVEHPEAGSLGMGAPGARLELRINRARNFPIRARPIFFEPGGGPLPGGGGVKSAGGVYPYSLSQGELRLSFAEGAWAESLFPLARQTGSLDWVNLRRLGRDMAQKAPEDPWTLDLDRIVERLGENNFAGGLLALRVQHSLDPGISEDWIWGDPFIKSLALPEGGYRFYEGLHRAISPSGGAYLDLTIDGRGYRAALHGEGEAQVQLWEGLW
ncbi:MAG: hypothetical protein LBQ61_01300 [Spirochaetales bacterium]|jgi:hypothetical protein|nr:hypothetical protein [Spirochaetales bacterium]